MPKAWHALVFAFSISILALPEIKATFAESPDANRVLRQAQQAAAEGNREQAVELASEALKLDEQLATAYYLRGRERFRLGQFAGSASDFDRFLELRPELLSRQWERGITLYYVGRPEEGAKQFEHCQEYYAQDVENTVWRFLCMAKFVPLDQARQEMLPVAGDRRVPLMEVYRMYRGESSPERVLERAREGGPGAEDLAGRLFYAHLYVGLWHDAHGREEQADKHLAEAIKVERQNRYVNDYMWDVAKLHLEQLRAKPKEEE